MREKKNTGANSSTMNELVLGFTRRFRSLRGFFELFQLTTNVSVCTSTARWSGNARCRRNGYDIKLLWRVNGCYVLSVFFFSLPSLFDAL